AQCIGQRRAGGAVGTAAFRGLGHADAQALAVGCGCGAVQAGAARLRLYFHRHGDAVRQRPPEAQYTARITLIWISPSSMRAACSSRIRMIGLMSMPPRLGNRLRIGRSAGSVMRYRKSPIVHTSRLRVSSTPKVVRMLTSADRMTAQI